MLDSDLSREIKWGQKWSNISSEMYFISCANIPAGDIFSYKASSVMPGNTGMNQSDWPLCETSVWPQHCSTVTFVRWSWKWLMFCSTPLPAVRGIVLPGNCLRPFVDCFGSVVNLRWPCLLLFISMYLLRWGVSRTDVSVPATTTKKRRKKKKNNYNNNSVSLHKHRDWQTSISLPSCSWFICKHLPFPTKLNKAY